ncbi:citrate/2-methylcitrate synthase [Longimicrobium sp.]|uniref:citrate/2-methylcitrate synthase n=1 Tax=Longimicrobium sp. TaxID=2029185 RepID=UPI002E303188|nr:citrate/2-methylcitrate synthase [Longimicrobium sp.]HEX6038086.1 citrate/2-methylcitrate synthase [Longimicrobium sp.]
MAAKGLEGVVVAQSRLSDINGEVGELIYAGYDIDDLARNTTFEEVCYLLWNGALPNRQQLDEIKQHLERHSALRPEVLEMLRAYPRDADPMAAVRTAISALGMFDPQADDISAESVRHKAIFLTAQTPTIVAAYDRIRRGLEPLQPKAGLGFAANFLYMLNGEEANETRVRTMDVALVLHAEHGMNASTFAARVTAGTLSDMYSAITSAIGTLKGPSHGGANVEVMNMLREIDESGEDPGTWVRNALGSGKKVMGFGHRVYKAVDPRATVLRELADQIMEEAGETKWLDLSDKIRAAMREEMDKKGKKIYPNVDFFSASVYTTLGIAMDLFTAVFALARMPGWTAHLMEQYADNRLIRPGSDYLGPRGLKVTPLSER